jgi:hypothetical protein
MDSIQSGKEENGKEESGKEAVCSTPTWRYVGEINIMDYLLLFMNDEERKKDFFDNDPKTLEIIESLLKYSPDIFHKITEEINSIVKNDILGMYDILPIVLIIKDIYNMNFNKINEIGRNDLTVEDGLEFIEALLILLINGNMK